jgi:transposase
MAGGVVSVSLLAVQRVLDGDLPATVADDLGVSLRSVRRWVAAWRCSGEAGLRSKPHPGRPPKLTSPQVEEVLSWINRDPTEFGFPTSWWTAPRVADLIHRRFSVSMNHRYLSDWLRRRGISPQLPEFRPAERDPDLIEAWVRRQWPRIKRQTRQLHATLGFTDEVGYLLAPLRRETLAPIGQTPVIRPRAKQRDKVSAVAALTVSPHRGHLGLYFQTYPNEFVDNHLYALFLRDVLWHIHRPLVLLHDGGGMHKGPPVEALQMDYPRLHIHRLPPYAPELNPPEYLWTHTKNHCLANFVPRDVPQVDRTVTKLLRDIRHDQTRLRSFFLSSPLPWAGVTGII